MNKVKAITLGADPEFELVMDGRVVNASQVIRKSVRLPWGIIGYDGAGAPLELRPNPSTSPSKLVENVGRLLLSVPKITGGFPSTMGEMHPIGGHVHIGIRGMGVPYEEVIKAVDHVIGDILYEMNTKTRRDSQYGERGDWRSQAWGVEYRTPPATMWAHPEGALAFLKAIKRAVRLAIERKCTLDDDWYKIRYALSGAAILVIKHNGRIHWEAWREYVKEHAGEGVEREIEEAAATAKAIDDTQEAKDDRIVKEVIRLHLEWPDDEEDEGNAVELEAVESDPHAIFCSACENEVSSEEAIYVGDGVYCEDCYHEEYGTCVACERPVRLDDANRVYGGVYCDDCYFEHFTMCEACGEDMGRDEAYVVDGASYCEECYNHRFVECDECGGPVSRRNVNHGPDGGYYCDLCYGALFMECEMCEATIRRSEAIISGGEVFCEECYNRAREEELVEAEECV